MEASKTRSGRKRTIGTLADHVTFDEHPAEKERLEGTGWMHSVNQETLRDSIAGILGLLRDDDTTLITKKSHSRIFTTYDRLQPLREDLVNKVNDDNFELVRFEYYSFRIIEDGASLLQHLMRIAKAMISERDFIAPVVNYVKRESEDMLDVKSRNDIRRWQFSRAHYSTVKRSASMSDCRSTNIINERTNKKSVSENFKRTHTRVFIRRTNLRRLGAGPGRTGWKR